MSILSGRSALASRLALGLLVATLGAAAVWANLWKDDLRVAGVTVEGNRILGTAEILKLAAVGRDERLFALDLFAVRSRVEKNPFVRSAVVTRDAPDRLTIDVTERVPVAAVAVDRLLSLDAEGVVLPHALSEHLFDLPVLTGALRGTAMTPGRRVTSAPVLEALELLALARRFDDELYRRISEIHVAGDGELILFTSESGVPVLFGRGQAAAKLGKFDAFWRTAVEHRGAAALEYVDLRFEDQVVARWRQRAADPSPS